jgi:membrane protease YdiL (CAAX protease family)
MTTLDQSNRLFNMARQGQRLPSALTAIAVVLVVLALAIIPGQALGRVVVRLFPSEAQSFAEPIVQNISIFSPIYLGLWVWLRLFSKRPFWTLGLESQHSRQYALRGALVAGLMMALTAGLSIAPGASFAPGLLRTMGLTALGIRFLSLVAYFVQGPAEEVLFRGWLLPVIGARYRPWIGVLVSSLIFSLAHAGTNGITLLGFLNLFLFGVFAAVYALTEGGLWGIGAWHAVWNWAMGDLLGFANDGTPHAGLLSSVKANGPDIITGGAFGLEGGLACTAVFLIAIVIVGAQTRRSAADRLDATAVD